MEIDKNVSTDDGNYASPILKDDFASETIEFSPFYQVDDHSLPNGEKVQSGGLYFMDDSGGVISQLYNSSGTGVDEDDSPKLFGSIDLDGDDTNATINAKSKLSARSYQRLHSGIDRWTDDVELKNGLRIINLVNVTSERATPPPNKENGLTVYTGTKEDPGDSFFIYDVANQNGQTSLVHSKVPKREHEHTKTTIHGMVFVEFGKSIYLGMLEKTKLSIYDPYGIFLEEKKSGIEA